MEFDHEKSEAYREAIIYVGWAHRLIHGLKGHRAAKEQMLRLSQSIPRNIVKGENTPLEEARGRFFSAIRQTILECAALQDVLSACEALPMIDNTCGKQILGRIMTLIDRSISSTDSDTPASSDDEIGPDMMDEGGGKFAPSAVRPTDNATDFGDLSSPSSAENEEAEETPQGKKISIPCGGCVYGATFFENEEEYFDAPDLKILEAEVGTKLSDYGWVKTFDPRFTYSPKVPAYLCPECQIKYLA